MANWTKLLKADPTDWLLEESNPSVRYLTLTTILDRKESHPEVKRAKADIMRTGIVPRILDRQKHGSWNTPGRFYRDKYKGTAWQLILLAALEADGGDRRIRAACEYILGCSQDQESYGFSYDQRSWRSRRAPQRGHPVPDRQHGVEPPEARLPRRRTGPEGD